MKKMIKAILYFLVLIVFISCEVCGISSEPELLVAFNNAQRFQKVKVLGANKQIESFNGKYFPLTLTQILQLIFLNLPQKLIHLLYFTKFKL